jgi:serine/threonine protein phosphatase PrpC
VHGWAGSEIDFETPIATQAPFPYRIIAAAITDTGPVRNTNQDNFLDRADLGLWAVADGLGGHSRGEDASQMVIDVLASLPPAATVSAAFEQTRTALERVNDDLTRAARTAGSSDQCGSTVVALTIRQQEWGVLWAGDSRAYLMRNGTLNALTRDHTDGITDEDWGDGTRTLPAGNVITRAVGGNDELNLDQNAGVLQPGDRFLLCSDGLHGVLPHESIATTLKGEPAPDAAARRLLADATAAGTRDNVTALIVDVILET